MPFSSGGGGGGGNTIIQGESLHTGTLAEMQAGFTGQKQNDDCMIESGVMETAHFKRSATAWSYTGRQWALPREDADPDVYMPAGDAAAIGAMMTGQQKFYFVIINQLDEQQNGEYYVDSAGDVLGPFPDGSTTPATGESNTASNIGGAAGLFKQKVGFDLELRTIEAANPETTVVVSGDKVQVGDKFLPDSYAAAAAITIDFLANSCFIAEVDQSTAFDINDLSLVASRAGTPGALIIRNTSGANQLISFTTEFKFNLDKSGGTEQIPTEVADGEELHIGGTLIDNGGTVGLKCFEIAIFAA